MACCKCCCGGVDCAEGDQGKCCCGGSSGTCCTTSEYCCSGVCKPAPCCDADGDCLFVLLSGCSDNPPLTCDLVDKYIYFPNTYQGEQDALNYDIGDCIACTVTVDVAGACCDGVCYPSFLPAILDFPADFTGGIPTCP